MDETVVTVDEGLGPLIRELEDTGYACGNEIVRLQGEIKEKRGHLLHHVLRRILDGESALELAGAVPIYDGQKRYPYELAMACADEAGEYVRKLIRDRVTSEYFKGEDAS